MNFLSVLALNQVIVSILYVLLAVFVLLLMVLIHELGHYTAGRILGFKIDEFSVGFGKLIFQKTNKRGEKISLRLFPLGGYCAFAGENDDKTNPVPNSFAMQKPWKRIIVLLCGPLFNFLSAILFSFILLVSFGYDIRKVDTVNPDCINYEAIQAGDVIYAVDGQHVDAIFGDSLEDMIKNYTVGEDIELTVRRDGALRPATIQWYEEIDENDNTVTKLGITVSNYKYSFVEALGRCVPMAAGFAWLILKSLWLLITLQIPINQLGGPISTISFIATSTQQNIGSLFVLLPLISANLALFNLIPFPALDGSHIMFTTLEWIRKKPINRKIENYIHMTGLIILLLFVVVVDILHFVL